MLDVGFSELLVFGIIALLVLGPEKLPVAARTAGKWYGKVKRTISNVQNDIDRELRLSELREQMQQEIARVQALEQKMQVKMHEMQQQTRLAEQATRAPKPPLVTQWATAHFYALAPVPVPYMAGYWLKQQQAAPCSIYPPASAPLTAPPLKVAV